MDYQKTFQLCDEEVLAIETLERVLPAAHYLVSHSCLASTTSMSQMTLAVAKLIIGVCDSGEIKASIDSLRVETYKGLDKVTGALGGA